MKKRTSFVIGVTLILTWGACAEDSPTSQPNKDNNSPQIPAINVPSPNIPQGNFPSPAFPNSAFPNPNFPETRFPRVNFPEVNFPNVRIQQGQNKTIYTLPADILFDFDKADIRSDAEAALQQISASINQRFPSSQFQINGYTDSVGDDAYNLNLSKQRATSVQRWLTTNKKVNPDHITTNGFGKSQPVAPNSNPDGSDNPAGRQQNRRVEIVVQSN